jgi:hypothetical protein
MVWWVLDSDLCAPKRRYSSIVEKYEGWLTKSEREVGRMCFGLILLVGMTDVILDFIQRFANTQIPELVVVRAK